jgi:glycosyltransferase involved in cell wall biosynthesis
MRGAYVTQYNANDVRAWSGLGVNIAGSLERQGVSFDYIGPLRWNGRYKYKAKQLWCNYIVRKRYLREREPMLARYFARQVKTSLNKLNCEFVVSPGSLPIAMLECEQPILMWADATFGGLLNFYPGMDNVWGPSIRHGHLLEKMALERVGCAVFASEWAARTAIELYGVDSSKVHVVPFGANLGAETDRDMVIRRIEHRPTDECRMVFLGVDWYRKGGDLALATVRELNRAGLKTKLAVVGCNPPANEPLPDFVENIGFINKADAGGTEALQHILESSHFLILPARAECFGVVFCEAASLGVPSLATRVGGIPTAVRHGGNGVLFERQTFVRDCTAHVLKVFGDDYRDMAIAAREEYETRLNWTVSGRRVKGLIAQLIGDPGLAEAACR